MPAEFYGVNRAILSELGKPVGENDLLISSIALAHDLDSLSLHYIKNKDRHEVDFLTVKNKKPELMVEVKKADSEFSKSLLLFAARLKPARAIQVVHILNRAKSIRGPVDADVLHLSEWLAGLEA